MNPQESGPPPRPASAKSNREGGMTGEELARQAEVLLHGTGIQLKGDKRLPAIGRRRITVRSAGCSTGEEVWTLVMVLADHLERSGYPEFEVRGTDVSAAVLKHAAAAVYEEDSIPGISSELQRKYLMRSRDRTQRLVKIVPELRERAKFTRVNLVAAKPEITPSAEIVFCRNVLIYFDTPTQRRLMDRLVAALAPGSYLFLGHSESLVGGEWPLTAVAPGTFRKRQAP